MKKDDKKPEPMHPVLGFIIIVSSVLVTIGAFKIIKGISALGGL